MNYINYSVNDFVMDSDFRNWVQAPEQYPELDRLWQNWLQDHPEKKQQVEEAKQIILHINFRNYPSGDEEVVKSAIDEAIGKYEQQKSRRTFIHPLTVLFNHWGKLAASIVLMVAISWGLFHYFQSPGLIKYATNYGEIERVVLPDSSQVTLNANSTISFRRDWQPGNMPVTREVNLAGEAYFQVEEHKSSEDEPVKFVVHTDNLDVQVLGTQFNVQERRGNTKVVLNTGSVQLLFPEQVFSTNIPSIDGTLLMEPGEMVVYSGKNNKITKSRVDVEKITAWRQNKFVFEEMPLRKIARRLEDYHGVRISIKDSVLAKTQLTGTFPNQDLEMVLDALPTLVDIKITRDDNKIIFSE